MDARKCVANLNNASKIRQLQPHQENERSTWKFSKTEAKNCPRLRQQFSTETNKILVS